MTATEAKRATALAEAPHENVAPVDGAASESFTPAGNTRILGEQMLRLTGKVLPEHARGHNRSLVLQTLYTSGAQSRADVARETGLTRVTVSDLVAELIGEDIVIELGQREDARPGKPAMLIDINRTGFQIVCVDLSEHDGFGGAVVDLDGTIVARAELARNDATGEAAVQLVERLVAELLDASTMPLLGIGIASPGVVDPNGSVRRAPNLGWADLDLQRRLETLFGQSVHVANDANVAVLAEHGTATATDLLIVKVGHGVGAGIILGGRPVIGGGQAAGEIGHVVVGTDGGPECGCGKFGCLEAWLAAPRLTAGLASHPDETDAAASAREQILREAGRRLGIVLAPVVAALNITEVVLSGPTHLLDGPLIETTVETLRNRTMAVSNRDLRLRMTAHGQDIVLRGAAVMVLSGRLGVS